MEHYTESLLIIHFNGIWTLDQVMCVFKFMQEKHGNTIKSSSLVLKYKHCVPYMYDIYILP